MLLIRENASKRGQKSGSRPGSAADLHPALLGRSTQLALNMVDQSSPTGTVKNSSTSFRYKSILANRSVPILVILVCFLVVANTNCDHVSSTNAETGSNGDEKLKVNSLGESGAKVLELETSEQQQTRSHNQRQAKSASKLPGLGALREIYLGENSKLTMLDSNSDIVQKFHPNGRYGRRSVDNFLEPHAELGKMVYDVHTDPVRSSGIGTELEASGNSGETQTIGADSTLVLRSLLQGLERDGELASPHGLPMRLTTPGAQVKGSKFAGSDRQLGNSPAGNTFSSNGAQVADYRHEMSKLLKCNYTGTSNLYWCESPTYS